jgi:hypothetical protein
VNVILNNVADSSRLGRAITRCRHYLKYRAEHHQKLTKGLDDIGDDAVPDSLSTVATSLPPGILQEQMFRGQRNESDTETLYTATSYAPSETDSSMLRMPARPKAAVDGAPFECPLCYHITTASDDQAWKQHVHEDLSPYVCLHEVRSLEQSALHGT